MDYKTELGYYFEDEDYIEWSKWKIIDLDENGMSFQDILDFDMNEVWQRIAKLIINKKP